MSVLIEARHLTKVFGGTFGQTRTVALEDFSLRLGDENPFITAVVGESGSGKTTLARLILGLESPTRGEVLYKGQSLKKLSRSERRSFLQDVQVVFQDPFGVYNPFYKVDHVLETPIAKFGLAGAKDKSELIDEVLEAVGLHREDTLGRYPHQLSGGQRQRIMVARVLLLRPRLLVADEPVSMIDASLRATVLGSLRKLYQEFDISLIYITHDLTTAYQISENIIVMYSGSVMEVGDVELVVKQPQHPYTQLLIGSVPQPDPKLKWSSGGLEDPQGIRPTGKIFCRFMNRCPQAMQTCGETAPPLYQTAPHRLVACYLYKDCPSVPTEDMATAFVPQ